MWSIKHTGYHGVVKDSYQRVCLRMPIHEFSESGMFNKLHDLVSGYMLRHIFLELDLKDSSLDYDQLETLCTTLKDLTLPEEKVIFTVEVANYERDNAVIRKVVTHIKPAVILLKRCANRNKTIYMLKNLAVDTADLAEEERQKEAGEATGSSQEDQCESMAAAGVSRAAPSAAILGVSGLPADERQHVLDEQRGVVRAMCLGVASFPHMHTCTLDLLHTRECNAYITIDSFDDEHTRGLAKFAKKYERPAAAVLVKALLELGAVVCIDRSLVDQECFYSDILRLVHPFTHLQVGFSSVYMMHQSLLQSQCVCQCSITLYLLSAPPGPHRLVQLYFASLRARTACGALPGGRVSGREETH